MCIYNSGWIFLVVIYVGGGGVDDDQDPYHHQIIKLSMLIDSKPLLPHPPPQLPQFNLNLPLSKSCLLKLHGLDGELTNTHTGQLIPSPSVCWPSLDQLVSSYMWPHPLFILHSEESCWPITISVTHTSTGQMSVSSYVVLNILVIFRSAFWVNRNVR